MIAGSRSDRSRVLVTASLSESMTTGIMPLTLLNFAGAVISWCLVRDPETEVRNRIIAKLRGHLARRRKDAGVGDVLIQNANLIWQVIAEAEQSHHVKFMAAIKQP